MLVHFYSLLIHALIQSSARNFKSSSLLIETVRLPVGVCASAAASSALAHSLLSRLSSWLIIPPFFHFLLETFVVQSNPAVRTGILTSVDV
jgi:hypothetical protein